MWSESVKQATYNAYGAMVDANPQVVECRPQRGLSDLAPAILQGMLAALKTEKHQLVKKGNKFTKLHDGSWNLDILLDMMFSFWVLTPISDTNPRNRMLIEAGIACVPRQ